MIGLPRVPSARVVRRALSVLEGPATEAVAALVQAVINCLDAAEDADVDCCADDLPVIPWAKRFTYGLGDEDDADFSLGWHHPSRGQGGTLHGALKATTAWTARTKTRRAASGTTWTSSPVSR